MMRYSVQSKDLDFYLMGKNIGKNISKNCKKTAEATGGLLAIKLLRKLRGIQKIHNRIIHKQLQINITKKYLKKDMYFQNKDRKLSMI